MSRCDSHRLYVRVNPDPQQVLYSPLGALPWPPFHDLYGAGRLLPTDQVLRPSPRVDGRINQLRPGVRLTQPHIDPGPRPRNPRPSEATPPERLGTDYGIRMLRSPLLLVFLLLEILNTDESNAKGERPVYLLHCARFERVRVIEHVDHSECVDLPAVNNYTELCVRFGGRNVHVPRPYAWWLVALACGEENPNKSATVLEDLALLQAESVLTT